MIRVGFIMDIFVERRLLLISLVFKTFLVISGVAFFCFHGHAVLDSSDDPESRQLFGRHPLNFSPSTVQVSEGDDFVRIEAEQGGVETVSGFSFCLKDGEFSANFSGSSAIVHRNLFQQDTAGKFLYSVNTDWLNVPAAKDIAFSLSEVETAFNSAIKFDDGDERFTCTVPEGIFPRLLIRRIKIGVDNPCYPMTVSFRARFDDEANPVGWLKMFCLNAKSIEIGFSRHVLFGVQASSYEGS